MADPTSKKALLVILDGYGLAENPEVSAIHRADKPFIDRLFSANPHSSLSASGEDVGLPAGQFGNSEVGHLNIGAGRIVWQELSRINHSINDGTFAENRTLLEALDKAEQNNRVHVMGLFSDGGVHSHNDHLFALLELIQSRRIEHTWVHAFTDGRDTSPHGGIEYVKEFQKKTKEIGTGTIASVVGRYYAMDRDNRWDRTRMAYELLVNGEGTVFDSPVDAFQHSYEEGTTDEFIKPVLIGRDGNSRIRPGDVVIFYNIRGDRARQITRALTEKEFDRFDTREDLDLHYTTFTSYDDTFTWVHVAYPPLDIKNTIGEYLGNKGLPQIRIAETEKYPHVTYFFNGGREKPFEKEERVLIPSPRVATYDLQPEMSAAEVADALCEQLASGKYAFGVLNFANPDMVAHTGDMEATIRAVETIDRQLEKVVAAAVEQDYRILIIADHGNADCMIQEDGSPHTAHTTARVPALIVNAPEITKIRDGLLADVAPTLLKLMELGQPDEMTGKALFEY